MITLSPEFERCSTRLLTFSGIAFSLKIIPLTAITISDVTIGLENRQIAIGLLTFFVLYLLVVYVVILLRDVARQKNLDIALYAEMAKSQTLPVLGDSDTDHARSADRYRRLASAYIGLDAILPALFAIFVVLLCRNDLWSFFGHVTLTVLSEFSIGGVLTNQLVGG